MIAGLSLLLEIIALGFDVVGDQGFASCFGAAVGVCGTNGADFGDGDHVLEAGSVAVDSSGGREDDVGDIVAGHGTEEANRAVDICAIILKRDLA